MYIFQSEYVHKDIYIFKNHFSSYICFQVVAFFLRTFNFFSGVVLGLYRGYCFDRLVVSFKIIIDSL